MRVLGVDPGLTRCGLGVVDGRPGRAALVAVGGYGRGDLAPHSDLDVVLVHADDVDVSGPATELWYPLWDSGQRLDHAVRGFSDVSGAAAADPRVALGLLDTRHLAGDPPSGVEVAACVADIDRHLDDSGIPLDRARTVVGTSGTVKTIACGVLGLASYDREAFDQAVLPNAATASYVDDLLAMTVDERRALPYMHPGRADVIGAGALIFSRILDRVPVIEHVVSEADILHGMAAAIAR